MKIAVLGCGAIGSLILGYLSKENQDATGVLRDYQKEAFDKEGLIISGPKGQSAIRVKTVTKLKEAMDLAIFASKTNDLRQLIEANIDYLKEATILSTQNGIKADYILNDYFAKERIVSGIVMFGATFYPPNKVVYNFDGDLILGNIFNVKSNSPDELAECLKTVFSVKVLKNIKGAKYLKLFVNLNNCIPACLGLSMQEVFSDLDLARLAIKLNREAYAVVTKSNIKLESLPNYPKERIEGLVSMPTEQAAVLFSKIMVSLSKEPLYGSILRSIQRKKLSEIDYINGEIVDIALKNNLTAPMNEKIVGLVHQIEKTGRFISKQDLLSEIKKSEDS